MASKRRGNPDLFDGIRVGDRVTIVNRFGQERSGRATIHNRAQDLWVLNMGGPHGTPGIATRENVTRVSGGRRNPYSAKARYRHTRLRAPKRFVRGSFRTTKRRRGVRVVVGKLKGERRRVRKGPRRGRAVLTAQAVLTPKRRCNAARSEGKAWGRAGKLVEEMLRGAPTKARLRALQVTVHRMEEQLSRGVHANPTLAVIGNPGKVSHVLSDDVQAVLYRHAADGRDYVHPFGRGVAVKNKRDGSTVVRAAVSAQSGVRALLLADGSVLLRHPTKRIWGVF